MAKLTLSDWAVLAALTEKPAHGFRLAALFAKRGELGTIWTVQRPQVYRALEHLESWELAEAAGLEPGDAGPPRTRYTASQQGQEAVVQWRATPVLHLRDARSELLLKLAFLERSGLETQPLIRAQLAHFDGVREDYQARLDTAVGTERLALEWRLGSIGAAIHFLERRCKRA